MKSILFSLIFAGSVSAVAGPAVSYTCAGINNVDKSAVAFNLVFADSDPEAGYTYQAVEITKKGWEVLKAPQILNLVGKQCDKATDGSIGIDGANFSMLPAQAPSFAAYVITFKSNCGADANYDVQAYCFFENQ